MATNFDYLKKDSRFATFADVAIAAEKIILIDPQASILNCRRAMEFATKWMYSIEKELEIPYQPNLYGLINDADYRQIIGPDIFKRIDYIRRTGNDVAHGKDKKIGRNEAILCLRNLSIYLDFIACCYSIDYEEHNFNINLIKDRIQKVKQTKQQAQDTKEELKRQQKNEAQELDLKKLIKENEALKEELSARRQEQQEMYVPKPLDLSEYDTRKLYIDSMLRDAGWMDGDDMMTEVNIPGMPNKSKMGRADYILYDDQHRPLAVVEAKRTCKDLAEGRQQAKLYADLLEKQYHRRPVIFLTNGFDTRIIDGQYPERNCAMIYSKRDLEKWFNLQLMRTSLNHIKIDKNIAGRYYQELAVKEVCKSLGQKRRKALLVMATGSGKTRTVISLCKILLNAGWIKNILFLADRNSLVTQAKRSFVNLMPDLSCTNLVEEKDNYNAHCVFSTYQTMIHCIDTVSDEKGKLFTCGHFDLVICDEAHRSIYNKYKDIFNYFDAPLVGLTATPKDEIDKNTYEIFELENGIPTYGYDLTQAVKDHYLVDYISVETKLKFLEDGIVYDELTEEEKEHYEETFENENGEFPEVLSSSKLNTWIFNEDTIKKVLDILMENGLKIDYGQKIGKTIIFAKNHDHAEKILEIFYKYYPYLPDDFAKVIDNKINYSQSIIDEFSDPKKLPQIAISVDMLDTGIDVPEILNLVFFKKVMSKAKFWQMIGRGTRLCPGIMDGEDKSKFYIFDFCGNFEFFRLSKSKDSYKVIALQSALFNLQFELAYRLQNMEHHTERLTAYRSQLVKHMIEKVRELKTDDFSVRQHLRYVSRYSEEESYRVIPFEDTKIVPEEIAPLIHPENDEIHALRFDALMYGIELACLMDKKYVRGWNDLRKRIKALSNMNNIPEVKEQESFIYRILHTDYIERAGVSEFEEIREKCRYLMKYLKDQKRTKYDTNYADTVISTEWNEAELDLNELENYKAKAEHYIRQHLEHTTIAKLKSNQPLTHTDIEQLEHILWKEIGTKKDYEAEVGSKPLGEFVREIVGLDMNAAKEAFSEYLMDVNLDNRQIYFVNQIIEYIVHNGMMKDLSVLQESPFTDQGSVVDIFADLNVWTGIKKIINSINENAIA